jgi:hypothetical protein
LHVFVEHFGLLLEFDAAGLAPLEVLVVDLSLDVLDVLLLAQRFLGLCLDFLLERGLFAFALLLLDPLILHPIAEFGGEGVVEELRRTRISINHKYGILRLQVLGYLLDVCLMILLKQSVLCLDVQLVHLFVIPLLCLVFVLPLVLVLCIRLIDLDVTLRPMLMLRLRVLQVLLVRVLHLLELKLERRLLADLITGRLLHVGVVGLPHLELVLHLAQVEGHVVALLLVLVLVDEAAVLDLLDLGCV